MGYRTFDQPSVENLKSIMGEDFKQIYRVYARDSQSRMEQLEQQLSGRSVDFEKVRLLAHSLKGSSSNVGALKMADLCYQLERMAMEETISTTFFPEIKSHYSQVKSELEGILSATL